MIPDPLQYFLQHFWIDQKSPKSGPPEPVFITKIQERLWGHPGQILLFIYESQKNEMF